MKKYVPASAALSLALGLVVAWRAPSWQGRAVPSALPDPRCIPGMVGCGTPGLPNPPCIPGLYGCPPPPPPPCGWRCSRPVVRPFGGLR